MKVAFRQIVAAVAAGALAMAPSSGWAHAWEYLGFSSDSIAMGGAMIGGAQGANAAYYNPAAFIRGRVRGGELSVLAGIPLMTVTADKNSALAEVAAMPQLPTNGCADLANEEDEVDCARAVAKYDRYRLAAKGHLDYNQTLYDDAARPRSIYGATIGGVLPLAFDPKDAVLAVGGAVFLPIGPVVYQRIKSPSIPYFLRYDDGPHRVVINAGVSGELPFGLRLGVGADMLVDVLASIDANVFVPPELFILPEPNLQDLRFEGVGSVELPVAISPTAGLQYEPAKWINIGVLFRYEQNVEINLDGNIIVHTGRAKPDKIPASVATSGTFTPTTVGGGVSLMPIEQLTVNIDAAWKQWSHYEPPFSVDLQISGIASTACNVINNIDQLPDLLELIPEEAEGIIPEDGVCGLINNVVPSEISANPYNSKTKFKDVVEISLGGKYGFKNNQYTLSGGYKFQPTPVPDQTGIYNILDSDTHVVSGGVGATWQGINFSAFGQYRLLMERTFTKRTLKSDTKDSFSDFEQDALPDASFSYSNPAIASGLTQMEDATTGQQYATPGYPGLTIGGGYLTVGVEASMNF